MWYMKAFLFSPCVCIRVGNDHTSSILVTVEYSTTIIIIIGRIYNNLPASSSSVFIVMGDENQNRAAENRHDSERTDSHTPLSIVSLNGQL